MTYTLVTGATGLLGGYLLRDLQTTGLPLAVLVRGNMAESACQRIETLLARWERETDRALPRPVLLEGDITRPGLGLDRKQQRWLGHNCDSVVHSAARLSFETDRVSGEPRLSNVLGTRHLLELCRDRGIRHFHHVSTSYVCGMRSGTVMEDELDVGQVTGNVYEQTKLEAEQQVSEATFLDQVTVYRPSIIVGDSATGYTSSFHGFYSPMRIAWSLMGGITVNQALDVDFLQNLELTGKERKNLVPVDWVSKLMTHIITHPELHGRSYHLTNPEPVSGETMYQVFQEVMLEHYLASGAPGAGPTQPKAFKSAFHEQMQIYRSYWRDDPVFDRRNIEAAAAHLPCPRFDRDTLARLARFALNTNFGWPREKPAQVPFYAAQRLGNLLSRTPVRTPTRRIGLRITGSGGGQWQLLLQDNRVTAAQPGIGDDCGSILHMRTDAFEQLSNGAVPVSRLLVSGRLATVGERLQADEIADILDQCATP